MSGAVIYLSTPVMRSGIHSERMRLSVYQLILLFFPKLVRVVSALYNVFIRSISIMFNSIYLSLCLYYVCFLIYLDIYQLSVYLSIYP